MKTTKVDTRKCPWKVFQLNNTHFELMGEKFDFTFPTGYAILALPEGDKPLLVSYIINKDDADYIVNLHNDKLKKSLNFQ